MSITDLENLFNKYGYKSLDRDPYIYSNGEKLGICFTYRDFYYGTLTRVYLPQDMEDAEDFLRKLTWYNRNRKKYPVDIKLNDYKIFNPEVVFVCQEKELSYDDMRELESTNVLPAKDQMYLEKIKRTAYILVDIVHVKVRTQQDTYNNLKKMIKEYNTVLEELENELSLFNKNYKKKEIPKVSELEDKDYSNLVKSMKDSIDAMNDAREVEDYISMMLDKLHSTEKNEKFIHNKYELVSIPLKIEETKQKIDYIKGLLSKKRSVFSKKESYEKAFFKIEEESPLKQIVTYESFLSNELARIDEKYAMIPDLDLRTTADFFIEFDNLNIKVPKMVGAKKQMLYEDIMIDLEKNYEVRSREEKNTLILYHSIFYKLKHSLDYLEQPSVSYLVNELFDILKNDNNVLLKIQYLGRLDTYNIDSFVSSLKREFKSIEEIEKNKLLGSINVFFKGGKDLSGLDYILCSNKVAYSYPQFNGDNDINYIATIDEGTSVLFVPFELNVDYKQDNTLVINSNKPMLILDKKDFNINSEKSDIIKVTRYDMQFDGKVVSELKNVKIDLYQNIRLERKSI